MIIDAAPLLHPMLFSFLISIITRIVVRRTTTSTALADLPTRASSALLSCLMCASLLTNDSAPPALAIFGAYLLSDAVWSLSVGPPLRPDMWAHHAAGALLLATAAAAWQSHPGPINNAARALLWMESTTPFLNASWFLCHYGASFAALCCDAIVLALWPWARLAGPSKAIAAVWGAFAGAGAPLAELARLPVVVLLYLVATLLLAGLQVVWGAVLAKRFRARVIALVK
jgi:hypothetical protein